MERKKKTSKRLEILNLISDVITSEDIYSTIKYEKLDEAKIKQYLFQPLQRVVVKIFNTILGYSEEYAKKIARSALRWEGDKQTTVNNFMFFGTQHRPDFDLELQDINIAIEIKRGDSGASIREGIGQSLVYTTFYDFCIYLFIDTSKDKSIKNSFSSDREKAFVTSLMEHYNIKFIVC